MTHLFATRVRLSLAFTLVAASLAHAQTRVRRNAGDRKSCEMVLKLRARLIPIALVAACTMGTPPAEAQQNLSGDAVLTKGLHAERAYFSPLPFEHFDPSNGNVVLSFTDLELTGNAGRSVRFTRTYNTQSAPGGETPGYQHGYWSFGIAGLIMRVIDKPIPVPYPNFATAPAHAYAVLTPILVGADGGARPTFYMTQPVEGSVPSQDHVISMHGFLRYERTTGTMQYPDGLVAHYDSYLQPDGTVQGTGRLKDYSDQYGNTVVLTQVGTTLTVTQSLGPDPARVVTIELNGEGQPETLSYSTSAGNRVWTYTYSASAVGYEPGFPIHVAQHLLETVTPPAGPGWQFFYDEAHQWFRTPQGGFVHYYFAVETATLPDGGELPVSRLASRTSSDTALPWGITIGHSGTGPHTAVTTPEGAVITYLFTQPSVSGPYRSFDLSRLWKTRIEPYGQPVVHEETLEYQLVPSVFGVENVWWGSLEVATRTIQRDGRTYTTTYTYGSDPGLVGDFHNPIGIAESSPDGTRTTTLTYEHDGGHLWSTGLFFVGRRATEQVNIAGDVWQRSWSYDSLGFLTTDRQWARTTETSPITTTYTRGSNGNVASQSALATTTSFTYSNGQINQIETAHHTTTRSINPEGTVASETLGSRTSSYFYDIAGRLYESQPAGGPSLTAPTVTSFNDTTGTGVTVTHGTSQVTTTLDAFGRPVASIDAVGVESRTVYDSAGRVKESSLPFAPSYPEKKTQFTYDVLGRFKERTNPGGSTSTVDYGPGTVTLTDENGHETVQTWRAFGHPDDAQLLKVRDAELQLWEYEYDAVGRLLKVKAPDDIQRIWTYNTKGELASETHPESGTVTYTYHLTGRLHQTTDANGTVSTYTQDGNGRLTSVGAGPDNTFFTYEQDSDLRRSIIFNGVSSVTAYDLAGRPISRDDYVDARRYQTRHVYDTQDRVTEIWYPAFSSLPDRRRVAYEYDAEGRIQRVFNAATGQNYAYTFTYHPSGAVKSYYAGNGVQTVFSYDENRYWLNKIQVESIWSLEYQNIDGVGNPQILADSRPGKNQWLQYDELDRLISANGPYGSIAYAYDAHGNRQTANGTVYTYFPGTLRLETQGGVEAFTWDNNGNRIGGSGKTFTYNTQNMMATSNVAGVAATYKYDADSWRIKRASSSTSVYTIRGLGTDLLTEWTNPGSTGVTRDYVYAGSRLLAAIERPWAETPAIYDYIIPDGPPVTVTLGAPNMEGYLVFDGVAGQRMTLYGSNSTMTNVSGCNVKVTVWNPDTTKLSPPVDVCFDGTGWVDPHAGFIEPMTLPVTGTYLIKIDPTLTSSGSLTLRLYTVPPDVLTTITPGGAPVSVSLIKPGHNAYLTFAGTAGQRVSVKGTPNTIAGHMWPVACDVWVLIRRPNLTLLNPPGTCMDTNPPFTDTLTLPDTGTYRLDVDPDTIAMGSLTVTLYDVPADLSGAITPDGPLVPLTITTPGQNAEYSFTGTVGQRMAVNGTNASITGHLNYGCDVWVQLLRPNGASLNGVGTCMEGGAFLEPVALLDNGTHKVFVDPNSAATGGLTLGLYTVPADATGTLTVNAAPVPVGLSPGQNATYTFSGTSGQVISVRLTGNTMGSVTVQLRRPNGTIQTTKTSSLAAFNLSTVTLSASGTHSVVINPPTVNSGSIAVQVTNP